MSIRKRPILGGGLLAAAVLLCALPQSAPALAGEPLRSLETVTFPWLERQQAQASMEELFGSETGEMETGDPLEIFNRFMFAINDTLDVFILRPAAVTYKFWLPQGVQNSVRNFLRNLTEPVVFLNSVLQGDRERAETSGSRFLINTAIGFGFFDPADGLGLTYRREDFGQTLAVWGVGSGPYLVLPLIGPSTFRDAAGVGVDILTDPFNYVGDDGLNLPWIRAGLSTTDWRARNLETLDEVRRDSLDPYARIRSLYLQRRQQEILNQDGAASELMQRAAREK